MTIYVLMMVGLACAASACYRLGRANWNVYRRNEEPLKDFVPDMLLACAGWVATCYLIGAFTVTFWGLGQ